MQSFTYQAKDASGKIIKAEVEATSQGEAAKLLVSKQLFPLSIEPRKTGASSFSLESLSRITAKDKVLFTRQLSTLVKAGLPIAQAMRILEEQIENPKMLRMIKKITGNIEGGTPLSTALKDYPAVFGPIYISMVEAGEASGSLDVTLSRLAAQEEKTAAINSKIRSAFTYPIVVLAVLIAVMVLMVVTVLPQVAKMYVDLKTPLPPLTNMLMALSVAMTKFWYLFILGAVALAYAAKIYLYSPKGRAQVDHLKLVAPVVSVLIKKLYMSRFARTLGSLVASGVPVLQALQITSKAMNNTILEKSVLQVAEQVKAGIAMSEPISHNTNFLPLVGQMIRVGEQTGTMGDSLEKVASYYEDEVDEAVKNISTLIEPATMVVLGGMVAFLIAAVLMPIYGLVSNIR